jgi:FeS assembly SUF system protein
MGWNPFSNRSEKGSKPAEPPAEPAVEPPESAGAAAPPQASVQPVEQANPQPTPVQPTPARPPQPTRRPEDLKEDVIGTLRTVFDPEIPVNVYELGLVYDIEITPPGDVHIRMTLTSPACPVAGSLPPEVETKIASIPGVNAVKVELVWEPPWSPAKMSEAARLQLNV